MQTTEYDMHKKVCKIDKSALECLVSAMIRQKRAGILDSIVPRVPLVYYRPGRPSLHRARWSSPEEVGLLVSSVVVADRQGSICQVECSRLRDRLGQNI